MSDCHCAWSPVDGWLVCEYCCDITRDCDHHSTPMESDDDE